MEKQNTDSIYWNISLLSSTFTKILYHFYKGTTMTEHTLHILLITYRRILNGYRIVGFFHSVKKTTNILKLVEQTIMIIICVCRQYAFLNKFIWFVYIFVCDMWILIVNQYLPCAMSVQTDFKTKACKTMLENINLLVYKLHISYINTRMPVENSLHNINLAEV